MLKLLFWILLLANCSLLVYEQGYLAAWLPEGREPERMAHQFNAENLKIIPPAELEAKPADATAAKADALSCSELSGFDQAGAKRFDTALQALALGDNLVRHETEEVAHNIVYIPSQGSKEGAEKKANELRHLGVNDFFIIQDAGDMHWGISLGVFKTEEAARAQLASLSQKGVHSARLGNHNVSSTKVGYQLRNLDAGAKSGLDKILVDFPHVEKHNCDAGAPADGKSDAKADTKADAKADTKADPQAAVKTDTATKTDAKPDPKAASKPDVKAAANANSPAQSKAPAPPAKPTTPRDATH